MEYIINGRCRICPRFCKTDRRGFFGFCGYGQVAYLARAAVHTGEEPCLSAGAGSGTVFFSGCNLGCVFCQNSAVSHAPQPVGKPFDSGELARLFLKLQAEKVNNINLVTPTHFAPVVLEALRRAKPELSIPVVWNSSGYENPDILKAFEGYIDIYLPDLKFYSPELSAKYACAQNYFPTALAALREMFRQCPQPQFSGSLLKRGVLVRHLVLPGHTLDSVKILDALAREFGNGIAVSLMSQYIPPQNGTAFPELERRLTRKEYNRVVEHLEFCGFEHGYMQGMASADVSFVPDFEDPGLLDL